MTIVCTQTHTNIQYYYKSRVCGVLEMQNKLLKTTRDLMEWCASMRGACVYLPYNTTIYMNRFVVRVPYTPSRPIFFKSTLAHESRCHWIWWNYCAITHTHTHRAIQLYRWSYFGAYVVFVFFFFLFCLPMIPAFYQNLISASTKSFIQSQAYAISILSVLFVQCILLMVMWCELCEQKERAD